MKYCTPEQAGIPSAKVGEFIAELERRHLSTHSVVLARGDSIFAECYFKPFTRDFKHRQYSVSKSFVSVAIGFCLQDGLLSLDDPMVKFFPEYVRDLPAERVPVTTVRELLQMRTGTEKSTNWFRSGTTDRTEVYFRPQITKYPDTVFAYDSSGSYMLGVIVEKLTGKPFLKYLQEKVLDDIGFSKDAYCIQCPGGHSFGDSGIMCTARDLMLFARFVLNKGSWKGKQYLSREYLEEATAMRTCTSDYGFEFHGIFAMFGMGNQLAIMDPATDLICVINSDNQGNPHGYEMIFEAFYGVLYPAVGKPLPEDEPALTELKAYLQDRHLFALKGATESDLAEKINGCEFTADAENPMGIKRFSLDFNGDEGVFRYENAQGEKELRFGLGKNAFGKFPEEGYSDLVATLPAPGNYYDCAASADWCEPKKLRIRVQIIDKYFGNLAIVLGFRDEKHVTVRMVKTAEAFLGEYEGILTASRK